MTMVHPVKTEATGEPTALSSGSTADAGGGFTRLNPADGLFLRAQHLSVMQDYAAGLAAAVGAGLGPGVAHGYTCTLAGDTVSVSPGLAFAAGRPLHSTQSASVSLKNLTASERDFWIVEIVFKDWPFGSEPVYGGLCEDPCGHGSGIKPYQAEGVEVRLRHDSLDSAADEPDLRRNRLASFYFERERSYGGEFEPSGNAPWLLPLSSGASVLPLDGNPWGRGTGPHDYAAVPLGVVWNRAGQWQLDTWIARRDLGEPTPAAAWQWRLGRRPRNVFVAQVLQFQEQLAASSFATTVAVSGELKSLRARADRALQTLGALVASTRDPQLTTTYQAGVDAFELLYAQSLLADTGETRSLSAAGFAELPPAGYLPFELGSQDGQDILAKRAAQIFGPKVDVRVRVCRADYIGHAVEQVQQMDRIPLDAPRSVLPRVDLLVPNRDLVDLKGTWPGAPYGWAAFVRRREETVEQRRDTVEVYVLELNPDQVGLLSDYPHDDDERQRVFDIAFGEFFRWFATSRAAVPNRLSSLGAVTYPAAEWGVPVDADGEPGRIWHAVQDVLGAQNATCVAVVGIANRPDRQSLAAARAALFVVPEAGPWDPVRLPLTFATEGAPEAIVICVGTQNND